MAVLPTAVCKAWEEKEGPIVFSTVSEEGVPNSIYTTCVSKYNDETLVVANNYFSKTMKNIDAGSKGSILFITPGGKAYQVKGSIGYFTEGDIYRDMKNWNPAKHPGHGVVALKVEEVYSGGEKLL